MQVRLIHLQPAFITLALFAWLTASNVYAQSFTATAALIDQPERTYQATDQVNRPLAAGRALGMCQTANQERAQQCELIKLNGTDLTTSTKIKAQLPESHHPLYLWRYQSESATVYLAGSIHILKPNFYPLARPYQMAFDQADTLVVEVLYPLPVQYQQAFDASEKLVLEVNLSAFTPEQLQFKSMQYGMLASNQNLQQVLSTEAYTELQAVGAEYGLPISQMSAFKPALVSQQLAVLALVSIGYNPNSGVEAYFLNQLGQRTVLQLENLDFQLDLLLNQPLEMQSALLQETLSQMDEFEDLTAKLVTAYLSGDDESFNQAFQAQSGTSQLTRDFMYQLMDERNMGMAAKIQQYLTQQGTYFVLIGAGHYVGDNSIIELLTKAGISGERIRSDAEF